MDRSRLLSALDRSWRGAETCRARLAALTTNAPAAGPVKDLRGLFTNDVDYYALEAVRIMNIAGRIADDRDEQRAVIDEARAHLDRVAPQLRDYRNATVHADEPDHRTADVAYFGQAVRFLPGGGVEYLVDPRYEHHDALHGRLPSRPQRARPHRASSDL